MREKGTPLLLPPADIHRCILFHIVHPHPSKVVIDFLNEKSANEWGTVEGGERRLSGSGFMGYVLMRVKFKCLHTACGYAILFLSFLSKAM